MIRVRVRAILHPKGVFIERYNGAPISSTVSSAVMGFFFVFMLTFFVFATALTIVGLDIVTALSAAASAVSNVGPGLGQIIGPAGNYAALPDAAKWLLSLAMLLGRLEILTVIVLLIPAFWRA
jgi:trk system potassium uptake protein TrkH